GPYARGPDVKSLRSCCDGGLRTRSIVILELHRLINVRVKAEMMLSYSWRHFQNQASTSFCLIVCLIRIVLKITSPPWHWLMPRLRQVAGSAALSENMARILARAVLATEAFRFSTALWKWKRARRR